MTAGAMITPRQRHQLLLADISRDVDLITAAVTEVLAATRTRPYSISKWRFAMPARGLM